MNTNSAPRIFLASMGDGGDQIRLEIRADGGVALAGVGCSELLSALVEWRPRLIGAPSAWPVPQGDGHALLLMREAILRARGEWTMPLEGEELCHCRAVPAHEVDLAVLRGARSTAQVGAVTAAGTQCGTCRPDIESVIRARVVCRS